MKNKLRVGVLGATGMVGQRFVSLLHGHPWYEIKVLAASPNSANKTFKEAINGRWKLDSGLSPELENMTVYDVNDIEGIKKKIDFVFSAVDMSKEDIKNFEDAYARAEIPVVSNNSAHRWTEDVPMIIPEINASHLELIEAQKKRLGTRTGFVAVKPNCSIQSYVPAIAAWQEFEPYEAVITTYQAISGSGKTFAEWPEMIENIIPYIAGEEEKSEKEPLKILGRIEKGKLVLADNLKISCQCVRVPVLDGHTAAVFIKFKKKPDREELISRLRGYRSLAQELELPHAPRQFINYLDEDDRPQVKLDVNYENGMGISIARLREDSVYDYKFIGLSHNTLRGAAGGALLCAELLTAKGYIVSKKI